MLDFIVVTAAIYLPIFVLIGIALVVCIDLRAMREKRKRIGRPEVIILLTIAFFIMFVLMISMVLNDYLTGVQDKIGAAAQQYAKPLNELFQLGN